LYEAFRGEILYERARELVAETTDRWCDLVRRGEFESAMQSWRLYNPFISATERNILTPGAPENISRKHYLLPIPLSERDVNKNLTQNPEY
ncbi:MAG: RagB/SusD family nutrient uptake outer membrane protein, partial [Muribaculaceae bacterium]|nr:RagB/SusD family nutrient uptake outer membrane protein [Muribaculaceae bacterium]